MEAVTPNSIWPKTSAPRAAAAVSGTACVRSVPTSWPALSSGYRNSISTIISEPEPTEVSPTISPPIMPMAMVGSGRTCTCWMVPIRRWPDRRSRT